MGVFLWPLTDIFSMGRNKIAEKRIVYALSTHRAIAAAIESYFDDYPEYPHNRPYWGPIREWNGSIGNAMDRSFACLELERPGWEIDPFNQDGPRKERKIGGPYPETWDPETRIRGFDCQFWMGRESGWAIISRGPDWDLDLSQGVLDEIVEIEDWQQKYSTFLPYLYDPTNGTISAGDIVRTNGGVYTPPLDSR
jgi:hypothetical protein